MGFTPQEVNKMSMWQFFATLDSYIEQNSAADDKALSSREKDEIWDWMQGMDK